MPIPILLVEFNDLGSETIEQVLRQKGAEGVFAHGHGRSFALLLGVERVIDALRRTTALRGHFKVSQLKKIRHASVSGLKTIEMAAPLNSAYVSFDRVTPHGLLVGWGYLPSGRKMLIRVTVDGTVVGFTKADVFREDLLKAGVGHGITGFRYRLPDAVLDGKAHQLLVDVVAEEDPEGEALISLQKDSVRLPFHFNLNRPWLGSGEVHAPFWDAQQETRYQDVRAEILHGDFETGLNQAACLIDEHPSAVFKDFGLQERHIQNGSVFETFNHKVSNRWGHLFGQTTCALGQECCKMLALPYNAPPAFKPAEPPTWNPLRDDRPWEPGGRLDKCPHKIRHFASKMLTVSFAEELGIAAPKGFATLRNMEEFDQFDFPNRYVLKPDFASGIGLFLMHGDLNLFDGFTYSRAEIREQVETFFKEKPMAEFGVEEFLQQEGTPSDQPFIPLDYKIHCFGGKARIIHVDDKNAISRDALHRRQSWLSRDWGSTPFPFRLTVEHPNNPIRRPDCYDEMIAIADRVASTLGDYVRVDMYATTQGPMLGEVTSFTHSGVGFTEYGNVIMGQTWEIFKA